MTSLIKNHQAAEAIAQFLAEGVSHPGDPETKQQATTLVIPMFKTAGKPPPYDEAARVANQTIGEAIVYLIEHKLDCSIIPNSDIESLAEKSTESAGALFSMETDQ